MRGAGDPIQLTSPWPRPASWTGPLTGITANFDPTPTSGDITSDGNWVFISNIFHDNSAIDDDSINLIEAIIRTNLFISSGFSQLDSDVQINFAETFNAGPCAESDVGPDLAPTASRFTTDTFGEVTFESGGITYLLQFDLFTNDPNIVIIGNTVWTGEGDINDLWVIMRLTEITPGPAARQPAPPRRRLPRHRGARSRAASAGHSEVTPNPVVLSWAGGLRAARPSLLRHALGVTRHCGWSSGDGAL